LLNTFGINFVNSNTLEMKRNEFIKFNDNLYLIKYIYLVSKIRPDKTQELKDLLRCDIVLRNGDYYYYCTLVPEAEIVE
jgi:hypothetical protein